MIQPPVVNPDPPRPASLVDWCADWWNLDPDRLNRTTGSATWSTLLWILALFVGVPSALFCGIPLLIFGAAASWLPVGDLPRIPVNPGILFTLGCLLGFLLGWISLLLIAVPNWPFLRLFGGRASLLRHTAASFHVLIPTTIALAVASFIPCLGIIASLVILFRCQMNYARVLATVHELDRGRTLIALTVGSLLLGIVLIAGCLSLAIVLFPTLQGVNIPSNVLPR